MSEGLRKFIEELKNNPEITSYTEREIEHVIITPLLNQLGWYISNTDGIKLQYSVGTDKVDYALIVKGKPQVFLEVKRGGCQFDINEKKQILNYADYQGVELAILTNGISWDFYLPHHKGSWDKRKFYNIDIYRQDSDEIASKFYDFLEKNNVGNGKAIENANMAYEVQKKEKIILETIPEAWGRIINEPHELLIGLMKDTVEKLCDYKPDDGDIKLFLKNKIHTLQKENIFTNDNDSKIGREQLTNSIIEILYNSGGKLKSDEAIKELYKKYENIFSQDCCQRKDTTGVVWKHAIHSTIATMRNKGLIKEVKESKRAFWELSVEAKKLHEKQYKN